MARIASIAALVIMGVIVADILANPAGVKAASSGFVGVGMSRLQEIL